MVENTKEYRVIKEWFKVHVSKEDKRTILAEYRTSWNENGVDWFEKRGFSFPPTQSILYEYQRRISERRNQPWDDEIYDMSDIISDLLPHLPSREIFFLSCLKKKYNNFIYEIHSAIRPSTSDLSRFKKLNDLTIGIDTYHIQRKWIYHIKSVTHLTNLTRLNLAHNYQITEIDNLTNLTDLNLTGNYNILSLVTLTNLVSLNLSDLIGRNLNIGHLANLECLILNQNSIVNTCDISSLTQLELAGNGNIRKISHLTNLRSLNLESNNRITNISTLTNLTELNLTRNKTITNILFLTNLVTLDLTSNEVINDVSNFTKLTRLIVKRNKQITTISSLTNLKILDVSYDTQITDIEGSVDS